MVLRQGHQKTSIDKTAVTPELHLKGVSAESLNKVKLHDTHSKISLIAVKNVTTTRTLDMHKERAVALRCDKQTEETE